MPTKSPPAGAALANPPASRLSRLPEIRQAFISGDRLLIDLVRQLVSDPPPEDEPVPENAYTYDKFLAELKTPEFRKKSLEEKRLFRQQRLGELHSPNAAIPLPDRYRIGEILMELWQDNRGFARYCLLELIETLPLVYGPWRAWKSIFKEAELRNDWEMFGALTARFDSAFSSRQHSVSQRTLGYLCRRAWRVLRRLGQTLPVCYPDVACDVLCRYTVAEDSSRVLQNSWVFNHIFFHQTGDYQGTRFLFDRYIANRNVRRPSSLLKYRAFADAWKRTPRPLFALLQKARCEVVREYATMSLKMDFRSALRDVEPKWVASLVSVGSGSIDEFVVWILNNVPRFEQSKFRELGLHASVLQLCFSNSPEAAKFAADYARAHARDLNAVQLMRMCQCKHKVVWTLALDLLKGLDPRKEVGLDLWGQMLEIDQSSGLAKTMLQKHFNATELTPEWLCDRLLSERTAAREFARETLPRMHPSKKLGSSFFVALASRIGRQHHASAAKFLCDQLETIGLDSLSSDELQRLLIHSFTRSSVVEWVRVGKVKPQRMTAGFLKEIAYHPSFDANLVVRELNRSNILDDFKFDEQLSEIALSWLGDVRSFTPSEVGFVWLMELVQRGEKSYHDFATRTMSKAFLPADFAPVAAAAVDEKSNESKADKEEINIDLGGASFVFTGKLATMTRDQAQDKVTRAGGANSGAITKNLNYLVIGDDGSPLYGEGRKGSKQLKAEQLIEQGSALKIISETAFLQMLAGEKREFSADAVTAGCERLWSMMLDSSKQDAPLARFARIYIRHHHPEICLKETDRPVDPGAEIPSGFLTFDRIRPLFSDKRNELRQLALELAHYEFARWQPPMTGLVELCESNDESVRDFVAKALTCEDLPEHKRYRIDPAVLTADAVYSFCESRDVATRALGMKLIDRHPRLRLPEELFCLTESPDGQVRAFVIRQFWRLYRERGIMADWKPHYQPDKTTIGTQKKPLSEEAIRDKIGTGAPSRPPTLPGSQEAMEFLLRRVLFELPPGPPPKKADSESKASKNSADKASEPTSVKKRLRPLPARQAKLKWVETIRDLAVEDAEFAMLVSPVLSEFMRSHGKSEEAACLVAITRIRAAHGQSVIRDRLKTSPAVPAKQENVAS